MKRKRKEQLWLALRFPSLSLEIQGLHKPSHPVIIEEKQRVFFANKHAVNKGVKYGMDITTAELLCDSDIYPRNRSLEKNTLQELAEHLYQFTPYIELHTSDIRSGVLLEVSCCLKLFHGIKALCEKIFYQLSNTHHAFTYGLAHSSKSAWLLSFQAHDITGNENRKIFTNRLKKTPIEYINEYTKNIDSLKNTGFSTLGDIAKQIEQESLNSLRKRFGNTFIDVISDIFCIENNFSQRSLFEKTKTSFQPKDYFKEQLQFEYPISDTEKLKPALTKLLKKLENYLTKRQRECKNILWTMADIYHQKSSLAIYCDIPQTRHPLLYKLSCVKFDNYILPFEVDSLELLCEQTMVINNRDQIINYQNSRNRILNQQELSVTLANLKAQLGESSIFKLSYHDSHIPEESNTLISPYQNANQDLPYLHGSSHRPSWLLQPPQNIQEKPQGLFWHGYLQLISKPEKIESQWWKKAITRNYFLAQRQDHLRLWVYQDQHTKQWYVHGIFS